jgi:hypothetical protein
MIRRSFPPLRICSKTVTTYCESFVRLSSSVYRCKFVMSGVFVHAPISGCRVQDRDSPTRRSASRRRICILLRDCFFCLRSYPILRKIRSSVHCYET